VIYGFMRIKNEARWIERVLKSMLAVCERIFVLDDHSTDETRALCNSFHPRVIVYPSPFDGVQETRDKNYLMHLIEADVSDGDWILSIDGDEEIVSDDRDTIRAIAAAESGPDCVRFQVIYLWDSERQKRVDGIYGGFRRSSMFRMRKGARFSSPNGGGFHCGNAPEPRWVSDSTVRLLHYGYMLKEDRLRKYEFYNAPDKQPIPACEDGYRHMVIGDVFPAEARFMHAGPLQLQPLNT